MFITPSKELSEFGEFFLSHLSRISCLKYHLVERLPELEEQAHFEYLKDAIKKTWENVQLQINRIEEIFNLFSAEASFTDCNGMIEMIEDSFTDIYKNAMTPEIRDFAILYYLSNIESLEVTSFQILKALAVKMGNEKVIFLLQCNIDEANADRELLMMISEKCLLS